MADLYAATISGDSAYTVGANSRKVTHDTFNFGTPDIRPLIVQRTVRGRLDWLCRFW